MSNWMSNWMSIGCRILDMCGHNFYGTFIELVYWILFSPNQNSRTTQTVSQQCLGIPRSLKKTFSRDFTKLSNLLEGLELRLLVFKFSLGNCYTKRATRRAIMIIMIQFFRECSLLIFRFHSQFSKFSRSFNFRNHFSFIHLLSLTQFIVEVSKDKAIRMRLPIMLGTYPIRNPDGTLKKKGSYFPQHLPVARPWLDSEKK